MGLVAKKAESRSILRNARLEKSTSETGVDTGMKLPVGVAPCDGEIVDIIVCQHFKGSVATDMSYAFKRARAAGAAVSVSTTSAKITVAAGDGVAVDARAKIAAVAGCVRPVISSVFADRRVKKGDSIFLETTENGAHTLFPVISATVIIAADY